MKFLYQVTAKLSDRSQVFTGPIEANNKLEATGYLKRWTSFNTGAMYKNIKVALKEVKRDVSLCTSQH